MDVSGTDPRFLFWPWAATNMVGIGQNTQHNLISGGQTGLQQMHSPYHQVAGQTLLSNHQQSLSANAHTNQLLNNNNSSSQSNHLSHSHGQNRSMNHLFASDSGLQSDNGSGDPSNRLMKQNSNGANNNNSSNNSNNNNSSSTPNNSQTPEDPTASLRNTPSNLSQGNGSSSSRLMGGSHSSNFLFAPGSTAAGGVNGNASSGCVGGSTQMGASSGVPVPGGVGSSISGVGDKTMMPGLMAAAAVGNHCMSAVVAAQQQQQHNASPAASSSSNTGVSLPSTGGSMNLNSSSSGDNKALIRSGLFNHSYTQAAKAYKCKICHHVCYSKSDLATHNAATHNQDPRPHRCEQCGRQFSTCAYLSQHRRIHLGVKPYNCRFCDRRFTQLSHQQQHERIHTGEKPYKCPNCAKCFTQMSNLQSHQRQHMKGKPHRCEHCFMSFDMRDELEEHVQAKHSGNRYAKVLVCPFCSKSYNSETYLSKHLDRHKEAAMNGGSLHANPSSRKSTSNSAAAAAAVAAAYHHQQQHHQQTPGGLGQNNPSAAHPPPNNSQPTPNANGSNGGGQNGSSNGPSLNNSNVANNLSAVAASSIGLSGGMNAAGMVNGASLSQLQQLNASNFDAYMGGGAGGVGSAMRAPTFMASLPALMQHQHNASNNSNSSSSNNNAHANGNNNNNGSVASGNSNNSSHGMSNATANVLHGQQPQDVQQLLANGGMSNVFMKLEQTSPLSSQSNANTNNSLSNSGPNNNSSGHMRHDSGGGPLSNGMSNCAPLIGGNAATSSSSSANSNDVHLMDTQLSAARLPQSPYDMLAHHQQSLLRHHNPMHSASSTANVGSAATGGMNGFAQHLEASTAGLQLPQMGVNGVMGASQQNDLHSSGQNHLGQNGPGGNVGHHGSQGHISPEKLAAVARAAAAFNDTQRKLKHDPDSVMMQSPTSAAHNLSRSLDFFLQATHQHHQMQQQQLQNSDSLSSNNVNGPGTAFVSRKRPATMLSDSLDKCDPAVGGAFLGAQNLTQSADAGNGNAQDLGVPGSNNDLSSNISRSLAASTSNPSSMMFYDLANSGSNLALPNHLMMPNHNNNSSGGNNNNSNASSTNNTGNAGGNSNGSGGMAEAMVNGVGGHENNMLRQLSAVAGVGNARNMGIDALLGQDVEKRGPPPPVSNASVSSIRRPWSAESTGVPADSLNAMDTTKETSHMDTSMKPLSLHRSPHMLDDSKTSTLNHFPLGGANGNNTTPSNNNSTPPVSSATNNSNHVGGESSPNQPPITSDELRSNSDSRNNVPSLSNAANSIGNTIC